MNYFQEKTSRRFLKVVATVMTVVLILTGGPGISGLVGVTRVSADDGERRLMSLAYRGSDADRFFNEEVPLYDLGVGTNILSFKFYDKETGETLDTIDVEQDFGFDAVLYAQEGIPYLPAAPRLILVPFDTPHTLDGFESCKIRELVTHEGTETYGAQNSSRYSEDNMNMEWSAPESLFSWNMYRESPGMLELIKYDPYDYALPSGLYSPVVVYFMEDYIRNDNSRGYLMFSNKVIRLNNSKDGGYISDDYYGYEDLTEYVDLQVKVDVDGVVLDNDEVRATVYDAMGRKGTCYGIAPCKVPVGDKVSIKIEPIYGADVLKYKYHFPKEEEDFYSCEVPASGVVEYYVDYAGRTVNVYGQIKAPVLTSTGETMITGIGGVSVSFTQKINGNTNSYVAITDSAGYYTVGLKGGIETKVCIDNKFFESYTGVISKDKLGFNEYVYDIELSEKAKEEGTNNNGGLSAVLEGEGEAVYDATAILFDSEGKMVEYGRVTVGGSEENSSFGNVSFEAAEGEYTLVAFDDSNRASDFISTLDGVKNVLTDDEIVRVEINKDNGNEIVKGSVRKLLPITVPRTKRENAILSPISEKSYINVPAEFSGTKEPISVSGHIECTTGNIETKRLYIYLESDYSKSSYLIAAGKYAENSLIVNQKVADADTEKTNITLSTVSFNETIQGNTDFSFRFEPTIESDIVVRVVADLVVDGTKCDGLEVGTATINGKKVTIEAPEKTTGSLPLKGKAPSHNEVKVYDNGSFIGETQADSYGTWEMLVTLPKTSEGRKTAHQLTARCDGDESEAVNVICDPEAAVLRGIYMISEGNVLPNTYVWTSGIEIAFKAIYENMPVTDSLSIFVLCSNDTMIELPASYVEKKDEYGYYGDDSATYITEKYPFGAVNLVPVKAWAVIGSEDEEINETVRASEEYVGVINSAQYRDRTTEYKSIDWDASKCIINEKPSEKTFPNGTMGLGFVSYLTEEAELRALEKQGAYHTKIVNDSGNLLYDCYYLLKNGVSVYGFIDYNDYENYGQAYILTGGLVDANGYAPEIEGVYSKLASSKEGIRFVDDSYPRSIEGQMAVAEQSGVVFSTEIMKNVGPFVYDCMSDTLNEALKANGQQTMRNIPWGDMIKIDAVARSGMELYQAKQITDPAVQEMMFYKTLMIGMSQKDAIDKKSYARINNALNNGIHSMETAEKIFKDTFVATVNSAIVGKVSDYCGFGGKTAGAIGGIVGDLMTGDMSVNGQVVLSGAQGDYLEAKLYVMKAFGLSNEELNTMYAEYQQGLTFKTLRNKVRESVKKDKDGTDYTPVVDPSGYVYEAVASNRIEGATVTLYGEGMEIFEAEHYGQGNPLTSDIEGKYAWDVPEGNWFVKVYKAGYEVGTSQNDPAATVTIDGVNYLPVLPPQLDVNIPLMSESKAHATVSCEDGKWYLKFDKYVQMDTVTASNIVFSNPATLTALDEEVSPAHTPVCGGKLLARTFEVTFEKEQAKDAELTVTLGEGLLTYNGKPAKAVISLNKAEVKKDSNSKTVPDYEPDDLDDYDDDDVVIGEITERAGMPGWAIALIVIAALATAGAAVWFFVLRKKK